MVRRWLATALALTAGLAAPGLAQEVAPEPGPQLEARVVAAARHGRQRTVLVFGVIGSGSGAVLTPGGRVMTNAHVVAGARYALCQWVDGSRRLMRRLGIDYGRDLALLEPVERPERPLSCYSYAETPPRDGDWVLALGFPGGLKTDPEPTCTLGTVLGGQRGGPRVAGVLDYGDSLVHDATLFFGNSGGPLIDLSGELVGINGALSGTTSFAIPAEVVAERARRLRQEMILLPNGRELLPGRTPLLGRIYDLLEPLARTLPDRVARASDATVTDVGQDDPWALDERAQTEAAALALTSRHRRAQSLWRGAGETRARLIRVGEETVPLTPLTKRFAVTKASRLQRQPGDSFTVNDGAGLVRVRAISRFDDLALLELPGLPAPRPPGLHAPVGSGAAVHTSRSRSTGLKVGVVSAPPRRTSATAAAGIQTASIPEPIVRALARLVQTAKRLGGDLGALAEQLEQALEARQRLAAGTPPRSYGEVFSIDAPVGPSDVGSPVLDDAGRLLGVLVAVPHRGTAYVVPLHRIRRVFRQQLGLPEVPLELPSGARLY